MKLLENDKAEAYVTFVDDKSAAMAFGLMNCENDLKITEREYLCFKKYVVHIANTWHQPYEDASNQIAINAGKCNGTPSSIFNLNEDCLRQIFTFCDIESVINLSQTCKTFNGLLSAENGSTTFRQFTTLRLIIDVIEKDRYGKLMTLGKARKLLRHVGPFITKIIIKKLDEANVHRYFEKIKQYVGEKVCEMEIYDIRLTESLIAMLQTIFQRLNVLKIRIFHNGCEIDFQSLCPNLKKLKIAGIMNIERSCKHWPNLQNVSLLSDIISADTFCTFISLNPHLKGVKFFHQNFQQIQSVAGNLSNVEKLEINCKYTPITSFQLSQLCQLPRLTALTLWNLTGYATIVEIFLVLIKFNGLRVLKLHISEDQNDESTVYELQQQTIAALAYKLLHLEKLLLFNMKLDESTVLEVVQSATQLKIFHIHAANINFQWSCSFISGIVNIRKSQQQKHLLKLFLDKNLNTSLAKEDQSYLRIYYYHFGCRHAKMKCYKK